MGESCTFSVGTAGGTGVIHYEWYQDGSLLPDSDSQSYEILNITEAHDGTYYCEVSDDITSVTSENATLTVTLGVPAAGLAGLALLASVMGVAVFTRRGRK
jgi:hypothetical protein